jgi:cell division topological specificity factor
MSVFSLFTRRGSAPVARDRLQVLLAYERTTRSSSDLLIVLREEILAAIGRHVVIEPDRIRVRMDPGNNVSILEVDIEIPNAHVARPKGPLAFPPGSRRPQRKKAIG